MLFAHLLAGGGDSSLPRRKASRILAVCPPSLGEAWIRPIPQPRKRLKRTYETRMQDTRKMTKIIAAIVSVFMVWRCVRYSWITSTAAEPDSQMQSWQSKFMLMVGNAGASGCWLQRLVRQHIQLDLLCSIFDKISSLFRMTHRENPDISISPPQAGHLRFDFLTNQSTELVCSFPQRRHLQVILSGIFMRFVA